MLADSRSFEFVRHFIGQWLQARDIESVPINARAVILRDQVQDPNALVAHGLAERDGDIIRPLVRLTPHEGFFFAHDDERNPDSDFVTGINNATRTLTALTVRKRVERALDLGTGCGVQALLATRHADTVVATDVNPRALHYAELNSTINETPVDARGGSWFEPVGREQFDLIVANPPFVISPDNDFVFRDSALDGDAICRELRPAISSPGLCGHALDVDSLGHAIDGLPDVFHRGREGDPTSCNGRHVGRVLAKRATSRKAVPRYLQRSWRGAANAWLST